MHGVADIMGVVALVVVSFGGAIVLSFLLMVHFVYSSRLIRGL